MSVRASFEGGPAFGATLTFGRAPLYLRVVHSGAGTLDVLDQLDDDPRPDETISVYRRTAHAHARGIGWIAEYRHVPELDGEAESLRDAETWRRRVNEIVDAPE